MEGKVDDAAKVMMEVERLNEERLKLEANVVRSVSV